MPADRKHIEALESRRVFCATPGADAVVSTNLAVAAVDADQDDSDADISSITYPIASAAAADGSTYFLEGTYSDDGIVPYRVRKLNADGTVDATFGDAGALSLPTYDVTKSDRRSGRTTETYNDYSDLKLDSAGNLLITGSAASSTWNTDDEDDWSDTSAITVTRVTPSGTVDAAYGQAGTATVTLSDWSNLISTTVTPDGKVHALIETGDSNGNATYAVSSLDATGKPDASFGTGGTVIFPILAQPTTGYASYSSLLTLADGSFLAVGQSTSDDAVDDQTIGDDGTYTYDWAPPVSLAIVTKITATGDLDATFGNAGTATFDLPAAYYAPSDVTADAAGNLTFAIDFGNGTPSAIARLSSTGQPDTTFTPDPVNDIFIVGGPPVYMFGASPVYRSATDTGNAATPSKPVPADNGTGEIGHPQAFSTTPVAFAAGIAASTKDLFGTDDSLLQDQPDAVDFLS